MQKNDSRLIDDVAVSLCADYFRRAQMIKNRAAPKRVLMEYAYINARIYEGACEAVGARMAEIFIREIGERIGYAKSEISGLCEVLYKEKKKEAKEKILKKIYYI